MAHAISHLAKNDDTEFFIELGHVLKHARRSSMEVPEVEWESVNILARFLVENWCGWTEDDSLPPLCLFENKALAKLCALAVGKPPSSREISDKALRKWVSRLALVRAKSPRIGDVRVTAKGILFVKV
jgi:hypothetical protein